MADALVAIAQHDGVSVRCGAHVEDIIVDDGRVSGVRLQGGEELAGRSLVSTVSARPLGRMLPRGALPGRLTRRLAQWRYGTAAFKIDYALNAPLPWAAAAAGRAAVVHVAGELADLDVAAQAGMRGQVPDRPALVIGQHTLYDPTRAPDGAHTL